ncbi:MAG: hypothetical protein AMXMBFR33_68400 [Candidatus Xenobia bacterium]
MRISDQAGFVLRPRSAAPDRAAAERALAAMRQELEPWKAEGSWASHRSFMFGWAEGFSDSPGADYENRSDSSLTSAPLSLAGVREPRLEFSERHSLESGYDYVRVEVQSLADGRWRELESLTGRNLRSSRSYDLSPYVGASVRVRLRLTSDGSNTASGITTGPIRIVGKGVSFTPAEHCRKAREQLEQLEPAAVLAVYELAQKVQGVAPALALWGDLAPHLGQPDYAARRDALVALSLKSARSAWPALASASPANLPSGLSHVSELVRELGPSGASLLPSLGAAATAEQRQGIIELARREGVEEAARAWPGLQPQQPGLQERLELRELARQAEWDAGELAARQLSARERQAVKSILQAPTGWRPEGTWARTWRGWDDSPGADYENRANSSLGLPVLDLNELSEPKLVFRESHSLEKGYDQVTLEASRDGKSWGELESWTGRAWMKKRQVDLSAYQGGALHLRFRLSADGSNTASGIRIGSMTLEGKREGEEVSLSVEDRSQEVRKLLWQALMQPVGSAREEGLARLEQATRQLGSAREALSLGPSPESELVGLAGKLGSRAAVEVWPSVAALKERPRALACLEELRRHHSPADVARLWKVLAPAADSPDFDRLKSSLTDLASQEGVSAAVRRFSGFALTGVAAVERSVKLHELARRLEPGRSEKLWEELQKSGADPQVLEKLDQHVRDFRPEGTWARVRPASWAFREVWQDSPGADYEPRADSSLVTPPISLGGMRTASVRFWSGFSLERGYDKVGVEVSQDGGQRWNELQSYTGWGGRARRSVNLDEYAGKTVQLRFRLTSDGSNQAGGISLGQLTVLGEDEQGRTLKRVVDPKARETRAELARLACQAPGDLPELEQVAALAGGTRNALGLWSVVRTADPVRRSTAAALAAEVGVESALRSWPSLSACPEAQLPGVLQAARDCNKGWEALASDLLAPDLPERALALNRLVEHLGEEAALQRWPALVASTHGTLADRVEAEELAARLEGRVAGRSREQVAASLADSELGREGSDSLRALVGDRQDTSMRTEDSWAQVRSPWWLGRKVWQDSPGADYKPRADSSLTSPPVSLAQLSEPVLRFTEHHNLESGYDAVRVEVSSDGQRWNELESYSGKNIFSRRKIDLSSYVGQRVQVRFRLTSDGSNQRSGISLANPRIEGTDGKGEKVVLQLDELPLEEVTPYLDLAVDGQHTPSQRRSYLDFMAGLPEPARQELLAFCREQRVSLSRAINALLQVRLTSDPSDKDWLRKALASLPGLLTSEQAIGETAERVTIGGVVVRKRENE